VAPVVPAGRGGAPFQAEAEADVAVRLRSPPRGSSHSVSSACGAPRYGQGMLREVQIEVSFVRRTGSQAAMYLLNRSDKTLRALNGHLSDRRRARLERRAEELTEELRNRDDWAPPSAVVQVGRDSVQVPSGAFQAMQDDSESFPVCIGDLSNGKALWMFKGKHYRATDDELTPEDVKALVNQAANTRRLKLQKAHALEAMTDQLDSKARRELISQDVKVLVWQRDKGRCVECASKLELEFDHIIPLAMGGSNTARNLQLLCASCNRRKGATLG
jgi:hypothetical protein